jgi:signal transduction histidine kinase
MAPRRTTLAIVIAFFAVVAAFIASGFVSDAQLAGVDDASRRLGATTLPRLERLIMLRSTLRSLDVLLDDYADAEPSARPVIGARIEHATQKLEAEATAATTTPWADGGAPAQRLAHDAESLAGVTRQMIARARAPGADELRALRDRDVHPRIAAVDGDARLLLDATTLHAESIATQIGSVRAQTHRATIALDASCVLLGIVAAVVTARGVRKYAALLEEHGRMTEARAAELEQFSARVAHDVLSPLTAVAFGIAQAKRSVSDAAALRSIERSTASIERVRAIVDGLYDFARSGAKPSPGARADVADVVEGVVDELRARAEEAQVVLAIESLPACDAACARGVLASIVQNLVRNAIKYIDGGLDRRVSVRARATAAAVHIEVADTGPGIPDGAESRIFQPYVRASDGKRGMGLGLATVQRLVTAHGGAVGVTSRPTAGSVFWVDLPRAM